MENEVYEQLVNKAITKEELAEKVKNKEELLPVLLEGVSSDKAAIRYGCANALKILSEETPEKLYPHMDFFFQLLDSKYRISHHQDPVQSAQFSHLLG